MMEATLVYPHQLYKDISHIHGVVFLVEDELFFRQYNFHQQKLVLHRASMKCYAKRLKAARLEVEYIGAQESGAKTAELFKLLSTRKVTMVHYTDPTDYLLQRRIERYALLHNIALQKYESPNFICSAAYVHKYFGSGKKYFLASFYEAQRKRLNILMDGPQPIGGKWSYDSENRKKLPKSFTTLPDIPFFHHPEIEEAKMYVTEYFGRNFGDTTRFRYPVNHEQAEEALDHFLQYRFEYFGAYQDAMIAGGDFLFHSVLSSALNIGLLSPLDVINRAIAYAGKHRIPLNSLEGFIRQVLGWREYIRAVYIREGVKQRTTNFMHFNRRIPSSFYSGQTTILPVDLVIGKLHATAYAHHIERLMVLGNFMLLCEFNPDEVYRWFMELFIDAYDWVMVPNVYGMSQFADGGLMSTKPYFSSSNYVCKMSDFRKGPWCQVWDGLFWRFMHLHRDVIAKNSRLSMLVTTLDKMSAERRNSLFSDADLFLRRIQR